MKRLFIAAAVGALLLGSSAALPTGSEAAVIEFDVRLTGAAEMPAVDSPGSAQAHFRFDTDTRKLDYSLTVQGYSSEVVTAAHIHRGRRGENGPVAYTLAKEGFLSVTGEVALSPEDAALLRTGGLYVNVHSTTFPGGFARGQMIIAPPRRPFTRAPQFDGRDGPGRQRVVNDQGRRRFEGRRDHRTRNQRSDNRQRFSGRMDGRPFVGAAGGPNRSDCAAIRGTIYQSSGERQWFLFNCAGRGPGQ